MLYPTVSEALKILEIRRLSLELCQVLLVFVNDHLQKLDVFGEEGGKGEGLLMLGLTEGRFERLDSLLIEPFVRFLALHVNDGLVNLARLLLVEGLFFKLHRRRSRNHAACRFFRCVLVAITGWLDRIEFVKKLRHEGVDYYRVSTFHTKYEGTPLLGPPFTGGWTCARRV